MKQKDIIKLIKSKENWVSEDLIKTIESQDVVKRIKSPEEKRIKIKFCHISGYEGLRDGTKTEVCKSLKDIQDLLNDWEIDFDETIKDPIELVDSIENAWADKFDDGGGSGWIE